MSDLLRAELARDLQEHSGLSDADYGVLVELSEAREAGSEPVRSPRTWSGP